MPQTTPHADVVALTVDTFNQEIQRHDQPVLVDFWAEWCPPCHMITPILADIARERAGSLLVRKVDNDEFPMLGARYKVLSLPTLILFRNGDPVWARVGARPKARLLAEIDAASDDWR